MKNLYEAENLAEFVTFLRQENGDSYGSLAEKMKISSSTLHRAGQGNTVDDKTLDAIADYAGVTREWLYALAKDLSPRAKYSRTVSLVAALLEQLPPETQESFLIQARSHVEVKRRTKEIK